MIPDDLESRPNYRKLALRSKDELVLLEKIRQKVEALNNKKRRFSKSVEQSKLKHEESKIDDQDLKSEEKFLLQP